MKKTLSSLLLALAAAALLPLQASAQDMRFASYGGPQEPMQGPMQGPMVAPGNCTCPQCMGGQMGCDDCPRLSIGAQAGVDTFRGISDSDYQSNFGLVGGVFAGMPAPLLEQYGIGLQFGATQGFYDLAGRTITTHQRTTQQQTFLTAGVFRRAHDGQRLSFGVVYDFMVSDNWGTFATDPSISQWRGQVAWMLDDCNEVGVYGTLRDRSDTDIPSDISVFTVTARAINQVDFFWHHKFVFGADGRLWFGVPENKRLGGDASLGAFIYGASMEVPLSDALSLYAAAQYMQPSAAAGPVGSVEDAYNVAVGLIWYPGRNAVTSSVAGGCWTPYLPTANNSTFLVDQAAAEVLPGGGR